MAKIIKNLLAPAIAFLIAFLLFDQANAVCPVCTVAVTACVGLSRWLGVDDLISGNWIGGLIVSVILWFLAWLNKKQILFRFRWLIVSAVFYSLVILPLYWSGLIGHSSNRFQGIDKLLFGIICGSLAFLLAVWLNNFLKKKNQGKPFFSFQKVVLPILFLVITSLIFYYLISC